MLNAMVPVDIAADTWIRNRWRNLVCALALGCLAAFWVALGVALLASHPDGGRTAVGITLALAGVFQARMAVGAARAGLLVTLTEVVVRNPLTTVSVPRADVERFEAGRHAYASRTPTAGVRLLRRDGAPVWVFALGADGFVWNVARVARRLDDTADALNALIGAAPAPRPGPEAVVLQPARRWHPAATGLPIVVRVILSFLTLALVVFGTGFGRAASGRDHVPDTDAEVLKAADGLPHGFGEPLRGLWMADARRISSRGFATEQAPTGRSWLVYRRCTTHCVSWIAQNTSVGMRRAPLILRSGRWTATFSGSTEGCGTSRRGRQQQAFAFSVDPDQRHLHAVEVNNASFPDCARRVGIVAIADPRADVHGHAIIKWTASRVSPECGADAPTCRQPRPAAVGQEELERVAIRRLTSDCVRYGTARTTCACINATALRWLTPRQLMRAAEAIDAKRPVDVDAVQAIGRARRSC
jgi:hypothetical protein